MAASYRVGKKKSTQEKSRPADGKLGGPRDGECCANILLDAVLINQGLHGIILARSTTRGPCFHKSLQHDGIEVQTPTHFRLALINGAAIATSIISRRLSIAASPYGDMVTIFTATVRENLIPLDPLVEGLGSFDGSITIFADVQVKDIGPT